MEKAGTQTRVGEPRERRSRTELVCQIESAAKARNKECKSKLHDGGEVYDGNSSGTKYISSVQISFLHVVRPSG
jgi:hypothetical protein